MGKGVNISTGFATPGVSHSNGVSLNVDGIKDLQREIEKLKARTGKKQLDYALRRAAKPLIKTARKNIKGVSRTLAMSIGVIIAKRTRNPLVFVGPRIGRRSKFDGWFAHFYEYGTTLRMPRRRKVLKFDKDGKTIYAKQAEEIKATPFMRPAWDSMKTTVLANISKEMKNLLVKLKGRK